MKARVEQRVRTRQALRTAMPLFAHSGRHVDGTGPAAARPPRPRVASGLVGLDAALGGGFPSGRLTMVAGRPRTGTSSLLVGVALAAMKRGEPVAFCSERLEERQLRGRMVTLEARVNGYRVMARLIGPEDRVALAAARERIPWQSLSSCLRREIDPFDLEDHLFTYRPRLVIADLRPRPPDARAPAERFATVVAGAEYLARLAAEHGAAIVLRWRLPLGPAAPTLRELPGQGALAEAFDTVLLMRRLEGESASGVAGASPADATYGEAKPGSAEITVARRGGIEVPPLRVPLLVDHRFAAVSEPAPAA